METKQPRKKQIIPVPSMKDFQPMIVELDKKEIRNPNFLPHKHTVETYRSQQRKALKRRKAK